MTTPDPKRRWFQFSLLALLMFVVVVGFGAGWFASRSEKARQKREAVEAIVKAGGEVWYEGGKRKGGDVAGVSCPPNALALLGVVGKYRTGRTAKIPFGNVEMSHLRKLTTLRTLIIRDVQITDAGLVHLEKLTKLEYLGLWGLPITDDGLKHLGSQKDMKVLHLPETQVTGAGLAHVARLTNLEHLDLHDTPVTDAGLEHLAKLVHLEYLDLCDTPITDGGLEYLAQLTNLKELALLGTDATPDGVKTLKQALPRCKVLFARKEGWFFRYGATERQCPPE